MLARHLAVDSSAVTAVLHLLINSATLSRMLIVVHMLQTLAASHHTSDATVTVLLKERRVSPSSETKLGKAPKNVDYIGTSALVPAVCWVLTCMQRTRLCEQQCDDFKYTSFDISTLLLFL